MEVRRLLLPVALAASAACAAPPPGPLSAFGIGLAGSGDGNGARTGMTFSYWSSGYRGLGGFAKLRLDVATGAAFFFGNVSTDDDYQDDHPYLDDYTGAVVYDMGLVYRFADALAVYGGAGLGNLYDYSTTQDYYGNVDSHVHSLDWGLNLTTGLLWLWGTSGTGLDVGYDSFDQSYRIGMVINYGGGGGSFWSD